MYKVMSQATRIILPTRIYWHGSQWVQDLLIKCVNQPVPDDGVDVVLPVEDAGPVVVVEVEGIPMKLK